MTNLQRGSYTSNFWGGGFVINITGIWLEKLFLFRKQWFFTDIMQNFDRYPPICNRLPILHIGRNDYRYRYIGFADMGYIGRYFISADTDMPTLMVSTELKDESLECPHYNPLAITAEMESYTIPYSVYHHSLDMSKTQIWMDSIIVFMCYKRKEKPSFCV